MPIHKFCMHFASLQVCSSKKAAGNRDICQQQMFNCVSLLVPTIRKSQSGDPESQKAISPISMAVRPLVLVFLHWLQKIIEWLNIGLFFVQYLMDRQNKGAKDATTGLD